MSTINSKAQIRSLIWQSLKDHHMEAFPGALGRIPNFIGAGEAGKLLFELPAWREARTIKCNPDLAQRPLRKKALEEGKVVFMAVPRLSERDCFLRLDPRHFPDHNRASSIKGAFQVGQLINPRDMPSIDLIVSGAVAVQRDGARLGKGGGFADLEYAIARRLGLIDDRTPVVTTVHPLQLVDNVIPMTNHDVPVDYIATPQEIIECPSIFAKPTRISWEILGGKLGEIPILQDLLASESRTRRSRSE